MTWLWLLLCVFLPVFLWVLWLNHPPPNNLNCDWLCACSYLSLWVLFQIVTDSGVFLPVSLRVLWFHIVILYLFLPVFLWVMFQIVTDSVRVLTCISVGHVSDCDWLSCSYLHLCVSCFRLWLILCVFLPVFLWVMFQVVILYVLLLTIHTAMGIGSKCREEKVFFHCFIGQLSRDHDTCYSTSLSPTTSVATSLLYIQCQVCHNLLTHTSVACINQINLLFIIIECINMKTLVRHIGSKKSDT